MFECVQICTVSDALPTLQHPPPVRSARRGLSGVECRPVQRVQRLGVCRSLHGLPWYLPRPGSGTACPAACAVQSVRVRWGLGSPPLGYMGRAGGGVVDTSRRKNSKKALSLPTTLSFFAQNAPPLSSTPKISRKNKKTPTKGLCSVLYLPYKP